MVFDPRRLRPLDELLSVHRDSCISYSVLAADGTDLYEGMSCRPQNEIPRRLREERFRTAAYVEFRPTTSRQQAREVERERIQRFCPLHNVHHAGNCRGREKRI